MSDTQEFKLLITGDATQGVAATQQMGDATRKLKVDVSDIGDETKRMLGITEPAAEGTKKLGEEIGKTAEHAESGKREIRELLNRLGSMAGLADLGAAGMGKMGIAVFAVGAALEFLKASWDSVQEGNNGVVNLQVKDDSATITANAKAWDQYADARRKTVETANTPEAQEQREVTALGQKLKLLQDILKAEEAEALAALSTQQGRMSPQAYAAAQAGIRSNFEQRGTAAEQDEKQAQIDALKQEQARLAADAAQKKAQGESMTTGNASAIATAQENAKANAEDLKKLDEQIELVRRQQRAGKGDIPEYEGILGSGKSIADSAEYYEHFGNRSYDEVLKDLERQRAQAGVAISQGQVATDESDEAKKRKADLLTQAGTEAGQAENLTAVIKSAVAEALAEKQTAYVTQIITAAITAMGQEHGAEGNNTRQGYRDAVTALGSGAAAASRIQLALQTMGNSNKEAHDALVKTLNDVAAENKKLAACIQQMSFNTK